MSNNYRQSRFQRFRSSGSIDSNRFGKRPGGTENSKIDIPTSDIRAQYGSMNKRNAADVQHETPFDENEFNTKRYLQAKIVSREPSYTKFKVPFEMICKERYSNNVKIYEHQFCSEMQNIIDNQPTAREATYFVRTIAYTTLWPPYHNERELNNTSRNFYRLTPKEHARFLYIMSHDFSYA